MARHKDDRKHVSKRDFVRRLAKKSGYNMDDVANVVDCIDETLTEILAEATETTRVEVNMTHCIRVENYYSVPKRRFDPRTKQVWDSPAHFRTHAIFSKDLQRIGG